MAGFALVIKILTCGLFLQIAGAYTVNSAGKVPIHKKGYCVWYGQCTHAKNCLYNGPAKKLTDPMGLNLLNRLCPELNGQHTCCSTKQLIALSAIEVFIRPFTAHCPACWHNFRRLYCQMQCNRDQSVYMDPIHVDNHMSTGHATIRDINYYVSPVFKQGLFDSCKGVRIAPGADENVLMVFCETIAEECTAEKMLSYMGNIINGYTPFIYFPESLIDSLSWMDITVFKCNKPFIDPQTKTPAPICSCQDCPAPACLGNVTSSTPKPTY